MQEAKLTAPDGDEYDRFGSTVAVRNDVIAVGAPNDDDLGDYYGSTYIFRRSGSSWEFEAKLAASDGNEYGRFGSSVSFGADVLLVGASGANGPAEDTGAVYAFTFDGQEWSEIRKVTAPDATEDDFFGTVMAASGTTVVVGATGDDDACEFDQNCGSGSAYVFTIGGIDCNENAVPDVCDIIDGDSIDADGNGIPDECELAIAIIAADPPHGAIDARQPFLPDGSNLAGWDSVAITFDGDASSLSVEDFAITVTSGSPPSIIDVIPAGDTVTLVLDTIITPGAWTIFTHVPSDTFTTLGYLPADVGGDCVSLPSDILTLIDALNGAIDPLPIWSTDVDRSGIANAIDILRVIDLLNGANLYDNWLGVELCPDGCPELGCP
ncbi:MAG: FG-GAP repeat protein [Planctomycetes bacterium]|nr:FG-GAP repeat protein [Planctomycetota bacterium]